MLQELAALETRFQLQPDADGFEMVEGEDSCGALIEDEDEDLLVDDDNGDDEEEEDDSGFLQAVESAQNDESLQTLNVK